MNPLQPFLERPGVMILDGGLATELEYRGAELDGALWSASVLLEEPHRISEVHEAYLRAGADCIVSASYQATYEGLARRGLRESEARDLFQVSVDLALDARDRVWPALERAGRLRPLVAASVGPYGAFLADGSEYRGDYGLDAEALASFHRRRLSTLAASGADLLAIETVPSSIEAKALRRLLDSTEGIPAWLSFSCRDGGHLCDGTPVGEAVAAIQDCERILAIGVNCTAPTFLADLLSAAREATGKPLVAYPNSGEGWDGAAKRWLSAEETMTPAQGCSAWRAAGARLVGGCCRTRPQDIAALREVLLGTSTETTAAGRAGEGEVAG